LRAQVRLAGFAMRNISTAKKELSLMKKILDEFLKDYEYAQSEEDMSTNLHQEYLQKIGDVYWKCKDLEHRVAAFAN